MHIQASEEFKTWAEGFSGCDGGNLSGSIWFCGIEYGGHEDENSFAFKNVTSPPYVPPEALPKTLGYQYNVKVAKLYAVLLGESTSSYYEFAIHKRLLDRQSDVFKMNLYPIGFHNERDELWEEWLYLKTGLPTKSLYRAWCQLHRFPKIRGWMQESAVRLVIATGTTYRDDFIVAFSGVEELFEEMKEVAILDKRLSWKMINDGRTVLAVTPFLGGRYGLNSDRLIQEFAATISDICINQLGSDWRSEDEPV